MTRVLRRYNYTHRVKIPVSKAHLDVETTSDGGCRVVIRRLDLSERGPHGEAEWNGASAVVEARRLSTGSYHREEIGTVASVLSGSGQKAFDLPNFGDDSDITFRIKVVDPSKRLLADGDGIRAGGETRSEHQPLIYLVPADLGEEIWRVDWDDSDGPRVLVNNRLPNCSGLLTRDPLIRGLIMPQIVREVVARLPDAEIGAEPWAERWTEFATRLGCEDMPDADDEDRCDEWVNGVVAAFAENGKFVSEADVHLSRMEEP